MSQTVNIDPVYNRENGSVPFGAVSCLFCKRETVPNGSGRNYNVGRMCTQSQQSSFLPYLAHKIMKQTKESSLFLMSVLFWLHLVLSVYTGTKRNGSKWSQKSTGSSSKWNGSNSSSVEARPISATFGSVPFSSSVNGVTVFRPEEYLKSQG